MPYTRKQSSPSKFDVKGQLDIAYVTKVEPRIFFFWGGGVHCSKGTGDAQLSPGANVRRSPAYIPMGL